MYIHGARQVHNKQSNTNQDNTFFKGKRKRSCPRTHDTLHTRQSALPTELPAGRVLSLQHNTTQHNTTTQGKVKTPNSKLSSCMNQGVHKATPNTLCYGTENPHLHRKLPDSCTGSFWFISSRSLYEQPQFNLTCVI